MKRRCPQRGYAPLRSDADDLSFAEWSTHVEQHGLPVMFEVQCVLDRDGRHVSVMPTWEATDETWHAWEEGRRPLGSKYLPGHACQFSILALEGES